MRDPAPMPQDQPDQAPSSPEAARPRRKRRPGHTAVVYFHGMGSQRRYSEISDLLDKLEDYEREFYPDDPADHFAQGGWLVGIGARPEVSRTGDDRAVNYIEVTHRRPVEGQPGKYRYRRFRFYEVYWAPITAGGVPMPEVLLWLFRQAANPWQAIGSAWRDRIRYRVSVLYDLFERGAARPGWPYSEQQLHELITAYAGFESSDARRRYPDGTFADFLAYLADEAWRDLPIAPKSIAGRRGRASAQLAAQLARRWQQAYITIELRTAFVLISLLLVLLTALLVLAAAAIVALTSLPLPGVADSLPYLVASIVTFALTTLGVQSFFQDYLGDVTFWTSYEETAVRHAKRREIVALGRDTITHVLGDQGCERLVVVAHSLGSSVAFETLLDLHRSNQALAHQPGATLVPLSRLDAIFTFGSPIDKIHYFFQNFTTSMHRFHMVLEDVRGDVVTLLRRKGGPVRWVNFWDPADIVSGPLHTPLPISVSTRMRQRLRITNVQVANRSVRPDLSHVTYADNRTVAGALYEGIFGFSPDPERSHAQPARPARGGPARHVRLIQVLALACCWLLPLNLNLVGRIGRGPLAEWINGLGAWLGWPWLRAPDSLLAWDLLIYAPLLPIVAAAALLLYWGRSLYDKRFSNSRRSDRP